MTADSTDVADNIRMLADSAGAFIPRDGNLSRIRTARGGVPGYCRDTWSTIAGMGWLGMLLPEDSGGLGLGLREGAAVARLLGAGLVPEPVIPVICALDLLQQADPAAIPQTALDGEMIVVSAVGGGGTSGALTLRGDRLHGSHGPVAGGAGADAFVLPVPGGIALIARDVPGLTVTPVAMHDGTFDARLDFADVPVHVRALPPAARPGITALVLHAGYLHGLSRRAFAITLDYLRVRQQFGVAIGSFQALQHRATEIEIQLSLAQASIDAAAGLADASVGDGPVDRAGDAQVHMAALRALLRAAGAARLVAREAVQMHGAIGYTDEADIGLYVRKIMVEAGRFGPDSRLRARFMDLRDAIPDPARTQPEPA